jgi:hypothetical protein
MPKANFNVDLPYRQEKLQPVELFLQNMPLWIRGI